jgi:hypothetical protein
LSGIAQTGTFSCTSSVANADGIRGTPVSATAPVNGNFLRFNGTQWAPATIQAADLPTGVVSNVLPVASGGSIYSVTVSKVAAGTRFDIIATCNSPNDLLLNGGCYNNNYVPTPPTQNVGIMGDGVTSKPYWYCSWDMNTSSGTTFYGVANCYKR